MESLIKIFRIIPSQEYKNCVGLFFVMFVSAILEMIGVGAIFPLVSAMGNETFLEQHSILSGITDEIGIYNHKEFIVFCTVGLIIFYFVKNIFLTIVIHMQVRFVARNQIFYSSQLLKEYLFKPYLFHINRNTGILLRNVYDGALTVFVKIVLPLLNLIVELATTVAIIGLVLFVDSFIAIVMAGFFGVLVTVIIKSFRKNINRQGTIQSVCQGQLFKWANQSLGAIKETKVMHTETFFLEKCNEAYLRYGEALGRFNFLSQVPRLLIESVVVFGLLALIILKLVLGYKPMEIVPLLGLLALAAFRLMPSASRIVAYYNTIKFQMPFFHELYPEFVAIQKKGAMGDFNLSGKDLEKIPFVKEIYIDHVAFSYDGNREVLKDVTLQIARGDFVGIIGASGVGKTTFVDVLLGLLPPTRGRVVVDGRDVASDIRGWQANLAYVSQTIYLIDSSIKENIVIGHDEETIDEILLEKVLRMAELYEFVESLPNGVNTFVGECGVRLSGGQRQRIGIARALYQKPEVLILDEATSALDNETEKSIVNTILKMKGQLTIISIAHRVSTLEACDYKIRFHDGKCEIMR